MFGGGFAMARIVFCVSTLYEGLSVCSFRATSVGANARNMLLPERLPQLPNGCCHHGWDWPRKHRCPCALQPPSRSDSEPPCEWRGMLKENEDGSVLGFVTSSCNCSSDWPLGLHCACSLSPESDLQFRHVGQRASFRVLGRNAQG